MRIKPEKQNVFFISILKCILIGPGQEDYEDEDDYDDEDDGVSIKIYKLIYLL